MFIQTESTPNPATLKFLPGKTVLENGTADFSDQDVAKASPLAQRLFSIDGVTRVFFGSDFVTVTKLESTEWDHIRTEILAAIMDHYESGELIINGELQSSSLKRL
mgnify:FL=1